jgi:hypothetical protein
MVQTLLATLKTLCCKARKKSCSNVSETVAIYNMLREGLVVPLFAYSFANLLFSMYFAAVKGNQTNSCTVDEALCVVESVCVCGCACGQSGI